MASVEVQLTSLGVEPPCNGCEQVFQRGAQMNAVVAADGTPMGWFCDTCIRNWDKAAREGEE